MSEQFNRKIFAESLAKLKAIGASCWKIENPDFVKARNELIHQVALKDNVAAESFEYIFSESFITEISKSVLEKFCIAISSYVDNFVNLHLYQIANLRNNCRIGATHFEELEKTFVAQAGCFHSIRVFLDSLVEEIIEESL